MKIKKFFVVMFVLILLAGISSLLAPLFIQIWKVKGIELSTEKILLILFLIVISKLIAILFTVFREKFAKDYNKSNFTRYIRNIFNMDYDSIIEKGPMNLLERASIGVNSIYMYMTSGYLSIYSSVVVAVVCLIFIANINYILAIIMFLSIPINYFGYKLLNKELAKKSEEMQRKTGEGFQEIMSYIQEVDYIKQLPDREVLYRKLDDASEKVYGSMAKVNEYAGSMTILLEGINEIIKTLLLLIVVYDFATQKGGVFSIVMVTLLFPLYFQQVTIITRANIEKRNFDTAKAFEKELLENVEKDGAKELDKIDELSLNINGIAIKDMKMPFTANGTFKKGDIIRINGSNGSGKSTFAKGLVKFRDLYDVKINGEPIQNYKNSAVRKRVEYVVQNAPIINGTLRNNLLLSEENIDDEMLKNNKFIKTILEKKSLDDQILANGANLSGGEKQKISFARALLSKPDILILDEICSNIDKESSEDIYSYLNESRNERITFIISHDELPQGFANKGIN